MPTIPLGYLTYASAMETYRMNCPGLKGLPALSGDEFQELAKLELAVNWITQGKWPPFKSILKSIEGRRILRSAAGWERYKTLFMQRWNVREGRKVAAKLLDSILTATIPSDPNLTVGLPSVFLDTVGKIHRIGPDFWRSVHADDARKGRESYCVIEGKDHWGLPLIRADDVIHWALKSDGGVILPPIPQDDAEANSEPANLDKLEEQDDRRPMSGEGKRDFIMRALGMSKARRISNDEGYQLATLWLEAEGKPRDKESLTAEMNRMTAIMRGEVAGTSH